MPPRAASLRRSRLPSTLGSANAGGAAVASPVVPTPIATVTLRSRGWGGQVFRGRVRTGTMGEANGEAMRERRVLYVARHGETDWNAAWRWQGHTDVPLNALGREQARALATRLAAVPLAGVVSSDLSRASETAQIVAAELGLPVVYADAGLRERSFGIFEGLTRDECEQLHKEAWRGWLEERHTPEGGETQKALSDRMLAALGKAAQTIAHPGAGVLVVTHGGAMRAAILAATGETPPPIANAAVWRMAWEGRIVEAEAFA
jgi:probable phosphoglycerate mutase